MSESPIDVLVTGGCGYIGSHLVPRLVEAERVDRVVVLDSLASGSPRALQGAFGDGLEFRRGDVREYGDVELVENPRAGEETLVEAFAIDASAARDRLGWTPDHSVEASVRDLLQPAAD